MLDYPTNWRIAAPSRTLLPELRARWGSVTAVEVTDPDARSMIGPDGVVLRCADVDQVTVEWPRYQCYRVDPGMVARFAPGEEDAASFHACSPAAQPSVRRVLVVSGTPILLTDQTLEALDPSTFQSTAVAYHPSDGAIYW